MPSALVLAFIWNYLRLSGEECTCTVRALRVMELSPPERRRAALKEADIASIGIISA